MRDVQHGVGVEAKEAKGMKEASRIRRAGRDLQKQEVKPRRLQFKASPSNNRKA
jgi:hypothetical protein